MTAKKLNIIERIAALFKEGWYEVTEAPDEPTGKVMTPEQRAQWYFARLRIRRRTGFARFRSLAWYADYIKAFMACVDIAAEERWG